MAKSGSEVIAEMAERQRKTQIAFSCGKDSIAAWLAIGDSFDEVIP